MPRSGGMSLPRGRDCTDYFANTSATGVIRTLSAAMFSFIAPITLSSASSVGGFSPSYLIGESASATSACFRRGRVLRDDDDRQVARA